MLETIKGTLELLEQYFVYIYPGFISYFVLCFAKAKKFKKNQITLLTSIIVSYVYIIIYNYISDIEIKSYNSIDYLLLLGIAVILPLIWNWISQTKWLERILRSLHINTTVETNVWDFIRYRAKEKNEGLSIKVFLDDLGIMYEGGLRYHESEPEKEQTLCLSGYRRYKKNEYGKYEVTHDYADDTSRWVLVKINDVKRVEIKYDSDK